MTSKILSALSSTMTESEFLSLLCPSLLDSSSESVLYISTETVPSCNSCENPDWKIDQNLINPSYELQTVWCLLVRHRSHHVPRPLCLLRPRPWPICTVTLRVATCRSGLPHFPRWLSIISNIQKAGKLIKFKLRVVKKRSLNPFQTIYVENSPVY